MRKEAAKQFENKIKDLLRQKFTGFKRYGAISGTLAGGGAGGTMGLVDAVKRDNAGEMEGMETKEKLKEYLKSMLVPGAAGMGAGLAAGAGAGELLRRLRVNQTMKGMQGDIAKVLKANPRIKHSPDEILERAASGYPEQNVLNHIGNKFKSILGK